MTPHASDTTASDQDAAEHADGVEGDQHADGAGDSSDGEYDGSQDSDVEPDPEGADPAVEATFEEALKEGVSRLRRNKRSLFATGAVGGIDLAVGVLALLVVEHATGSKMLGSLAFSIGFIALILARSELFTENFLVPIAAVVASEGTVPQVLRLWGGTGLFNLVAGWVMMALIVLGVPDIRESAVLQELGRHFIEAGITFGTFASAVLAGAIMTLMTWMERANSDIVGKLVAAIAAGFLLAATPLLHSIVSSLEMFGSLIAGADFGYADWAGMFGWAVLGNMVGGIGLVTMIRFFQVGREAIQARRDD
ncbi:MAG: formate/nitrite transporter family protein [Nitriliruptorales bacterium]|nr:formate/nitrite transporter family protein [Nitriliruptorales bacterium]